MSTHLHIQPFNGVAGDMLLSALVHLGADPEALRSAVNRLPVPAVRDIDLEFHPHRSHGTDGVRLELAVRPQSPQPALSTGDLRSILRAADLPDAVRAGALRCLALLAEAEAPNQGLPADEVRFHELGGVDTLVDLVGVFSALELLRIDSVSCDPLPLANGVIRRAGEVLPAPAPATLRLLSGIPTVPLELPGEWLTPTGVALVRTMEASFDTNTGSIFRAAGTGFGYSTAPDRPNCLRMFLTEVADPVPVQERLVVCETNLDDMSAEWFPPLMEACFQAGALDVWLTPLWMKKGRPGHLFSALCRPSNADRVRTAMFRHSSSFGVRSHEVLREATERTWVRVETPWGPVRIKCASRGGEALSRSPEFEDCAELSRQAGVPISQVYRAALAADRGGKEGQHANQAEPDRNRV